MSWLDKILPSRIRATKDEKGSVPEGLWHKCSNCGAVLYTAEFDKNKHVVRNAIITKEYQRESA